MPEKAKTDYVAEMEDSGMVESYGGQTRGKSLVRVERRNRVLKLRRQGFTYDAISSVLTNGEDGEEPMPTSAEGARDVVRRYVESMAGEDEETAEVLRQIDTERLEQMYRRLELDAQSSDPQVKARAISQQLKVLERHAKLHGLDAPTKVNVSGDVAHHLVADAERVKQVDESFARRHGAAIQLPAGGARKVS